MTSDSLADHLVATFNALAGQPIAFRAEKPADVAVVEAERADFGVFVVAKDELEEPFDQGDTCRRTRVVSIAANGPIGVTLTLAKYLDQMERLRLALEGTEFGGYRWRGNEPISLWDREALRVRNRFMALFEATYDNFS